MNMENKNNLRQRLEEELKNVKDELEIQTWGLNKTNEAIKLLYKELEEKNTRLQELDRMKSDFIATVSHELRTPLSITKEGISMMLDGIPGAINEKQKKILTTAMDSINRLNRMISELLDISKIESGKAELKRELVDIAALIKQVALSFDLKAREKNLILKTVFAKNRIDIYIDPDKITQVFTNLIANAMKFTENGYIEISAEDNKDDVVCRVSDTGRGIAKKDLPRVFSKFEQFGRTAGPGEKGTGLGLSIAKGIVEMHKGLISVESEPGKGTKFTFNLPKYTAETLFKEYVTNGIKKAMEKSSRASIIVISLAGFPALDKIISPEEIRAVLEEIRGVVNSSLRHSGDAVIKDTGEIIVVLVDCDKNGCFNVVSRLEQAVKDYLEKKNLTERIKLRFGCATYPDEGKSDEELIAVAKKKPERRR